MPCAHEARSVWGSCGPFGREHDAHLVTLVCCSSRSCPPDKVGFIPHWRKGNYDEVCDLQVV
jgi:hypothetical protein